MNPPEEVADWHDGVLVCQMALKDALDDAPGPGEGVSEDEYIISVLFPVGLQRQLDITEAIKGMDPDLRMKQREEPDDVFRVLSLPRHASMLCST